MQILDHQDNCLQLGDVFDEGGDLTEPALGCRSGSPARQFGALFRADEPG